MVTASTTPPPVGSGLDRSTRRAAASVLPSFDHATALNRPTTFGHSASNLRACFSVLASYTRTTPHPTAISFPSGDHANEFTRCAPSGAMVPSSAPVVASQTLRTPSLSESAGFQWMPANRDPSGLNAAPRPNTHFTSPYAPPFCPARTGASPLKSPRRWCAWPSNSARAVPSGENAAVVPVSTAFGCSRFFVASAFPVVASSVRNSSFTSTNSDLPSAANAANSASAANTFFCVSASHTIAEPLPTETNVLPSGAYDTE